MDEALKEAAKQVPVAVVIGGIGYLVLKAFLAHLTKREEAHGAAIAARDSSFREQAKDCHATTTRAIEVIDKNTQAIGENTATLRDLRGPLEEAKRLARSRAG